MAYSTHRSRLAGPEPAKHKEEKDASPIPAEKSRANARALDEFSDHRTTEEEGRSSDDDDRRCVPNESRSIDVSFLSSDNMYAERDDSDSVSKISKVGGRWIPADEDLRPVRDINDASLEGVATNEKVAVAVEVSEEKMVMPPPASAEWRSSSQAGKTLLDDDEMTVKTSNESETSNEKSGSDSDISDASAVSEMFDGANKIKETDDVERRGKADSPWWLESRERIRLENEERRSAKVAQASFLRMRSQEEPLSSPETQTKKKTKKTKSAKKTKEAQNECEEIDRVIRQSDAEVERRRAAIVDLEKRRQETATLLEQRKVEIEELEKRRVEDEAEIKKCRQVQLEEEKRRSELAAIKAEMDEKAAKEKECLRKEAAEKKKWRREDEKAARRLADEIVKNAYRRKKFEPALEEAERSYRRLKLRDDEAKVGAAIERGRNVLSELERQGQEVQAQLEAKRREINDLMRKRDEEVAELQHSRIQKEEEEQRLRELSVLKADLEAYLEMDAREAVHPRDRYSVMAEKGEQRHKERVAVKLERRASERLHEGTKLGSVSLTTDELKAFEAKEIALRREKEIAELEESKRKAAEEVEELAQRKKDREEARRLADAVLANVLDRREKERLLEKENPDPMPTRSDEAKYAEGRSFERKAAVDSKELAQREKDREAARKLADKILADVLQRRERERLLEKAKVDPVTMQCGEINDAKSNTIALLRQKEIADLQEFKRKAAKDMKELTRLKKYREVASHVADIVLTNALSRREKKWQHEKTKIDQAPMSCREVESDEKRMKGKRGELLESPLLETECGPAEVATRTCHDEMKDESVPNVTAAILEENPCRKKCEEAAKKPTKDMLKKDLNKADQMRLGEIEQKCKEKEKQKADGLQMETPLPSQIVATGVTETDILCKGDEPKENHKLNGVDADRSLSEQTNLQALTKNVESMLLREHDAKLQEVMEANQVLLEQIMRNHETDVEKLAVPLTRQGEAEKLAANLTRKDEVENLASSSIRQCEVKDSANQDMDEDILQIENEVYSIDDEFVDAEAAAFESRLQIIQMRVRQKHADMVHALLLGQQKDGHAAINGKAKSKGKTQDDVEACEEGVEIHATEHVWMAADVVDDKVIKKKAQSLAYEPVVKTKIDLSPCITDAIDSQAAEFEKMVDEMTLHLRERRKFALDQVVKENKVKLARLKLEQIESERLTGERFFHPLESEALRLVKEEDKTANKPRKSKMKFSMAALSTAIARKEENNESDKLRSDNEATAKSDKYTTCAQERRARLSSNPMGVVSIGKNVASHNNTSRDKAKTNKRSVFKKLLSSKRNIDKYATSDDCVLAASNKAIETVNKKAADVADSPKKPRRRERRSIETKGSSRAKGSNGRESKRKTSAVVRQKEAEGNSTNQDENLKTFENDRLETGLWPVSEANERSIKTSLNEKLHSEEELINPLDILRKNVNNEWEVVLK